MAPQNPLGKLKDAARDTIRHPLGTAAKAAGQAVEQARGTVDLGRTVAGLAAKTASGAVASRIPGLRHPSATQAAEAAPVVGPDARPAQAQPADEPRKTQGDPLKPARKQSTKKTTAAKKSAPAKKAPARKTASPAGAAAKATPGAKKTTRKSTAKKTTAKKAAPAASAIDAAADTEHVQATPAELAKKAPASKSPAKKALAEDTAAPAAKKAPGQEPGSDRPLSAEELAAGAGTETITPVGTRGADVAHNPDTAETDLQQPGTEPLVDPATTKSVASEARTLGAAAEPDQEGKA